ncbi:hypothetical protein D3C71_901150 [compost metagenome]
MMKELGSNNKAGESAKSSGSDTDQIKQTASGCLKHSFISRNTIPGNPTTETGLD